MKLVIVESPSKATTIEKYLGKPYVVRSSIGHIRDLPKSGTKAIDIDRGFIPNYIISPGKQKVVTELTALAHKADEILLATDPDREGEAIAWHLEEILQDAKVKAPVRRITFNEITQEAVQDSLTRPREVNQNLRKAQEARRVLDRLVGYDLSGLIWKKVRYGLSAGRVQSPALRILMEREREIRAFIPEKFYVINGIFSAHNLSFPLICDDKPASLEEANRIIDEGNRGTWSVVSIQESRMQRNPRAPYTTSTLQQEASTRLGFSPSRTMRAAQKLYEAGHITYMRTDSTMMSSQALAQISALVISEFGKEYLNTRQYATKSKSAQEAHEAIRPTRFQKKIVSTGDERSLYELIWRRSVASQMSSADLLKTKVSANINSSTIPNFSTHGSRVLFDGWLKVDTRAHGEDTEVPKLSEGDRLKLIELKREDKETQPPNHYSEAGLIKELEKRGIGRPSTYASIIQTLVSRGYVDKQGRTLIPTDTGDVVSSFLEEHFGTYISDTFTADMENELDGIAHGENDYTETLSHFYQPFRKEVASKEGIPKITNLGVADAKHVCPTCGASMVIKLGRTGKFLSCSLYPNCEGVLGLDGIALSEDTPLGSDPKSGEPVYVLTGKFGPYVQLGKKSDENPKPKRASLPNGKNPTTVTLEEAIHLLILPRQLGIHPESGEPIISNIGRFGPYVGHGRTFASLKKPFDPYTIGFEEAREVLSRPKALPKGVELIRVLGKHPKTGKELRLLQSKSGTFIQKGLKRIFLPKSTNVEEFQLEDAVQLLSFS